jgi:hypothetical protein
MNTYEVRHRLPALRSANFSRTGRIGSGDIASSVLSLTEDSQIGADLRVCADEEDRADFDQLC